MDHTALELMLSHGARMPSMREDDISRDARNFQREYGFTPPGLGTDSRADDLADDLREISKPHVLDSLPGEDHDAEDMQRIALSQPSGEKDANGRELSYGESLYGPSWNNGPSNYTRQRKYEEARQVVVDTAHMEPGERTAHRALEVGHRAYMQKHGHISREDYIAAGVALANANVPWSMDRYNELIASGSAQISNAETDEGSPDQQLGGKVTNTPADRHPDHDGRTVGITGHERPAPGPRKKDSEPVEGDWLRELQAAQIKAGIY